MSAADGFNLAGLSALVNETEFGALFYQSALMANDTFTFVQQNGQVLTGAKNDTYKLPTMSSTATLQSGDGCGHNEVDETTFAQTTLTMVNVKVEGQFCPQTLEPYYLASTLPAGQHYSALGSLQANIIAEVERQIAKKMAILPYYGPTGSDTVTFANHWMKLLEDAYGINVGTSTPTSGGSAGTDAAGVFNIVESLADVFYNNADTAADANNGNIVVAMSPKNARLYFQNYRKLFGDNTITPSLQQLATGNYTTWIHPGTQIMIATQNALGTEGQIIATRKGNQVLAFDLATDATRLDLWYDKTDDLIYWRQRVKMGAAWRAINSSNVNYWGAAS